LLQSVLDNAPEPLDCYYINLSTFETELLNKRKILTSYEAIMASAIDTAKENAKKKVTITCTKGKLTKKVTAINPKCPKGYKKK
jgi:hypothetical protein